MHLNKKKTIIFTDLDSTLLDHYTYSFEKALPALTLLKEKNIPLIICSSKTRKEIEYYRELLNNKDPFVSENGGGIFIPKGYFKFRDSRFKLEEDGRYKTLRLGAKYSDLRKAIIELKNEGFDIKGFGDMTVEELADIAGLSLEEAKMAKERDFDEPFIFNGNDVDLKRLFESINKKGFKYTKGRFFHILGNSDKGKAVEILIELYRKEYKKITTIAIGDSPNDIPMLERVNYPVVVQKPDGSYDQEIKIPHLLRADGIGPEGWNKSIISLLSHC